MSNTSPIRPEPQNGRRSNSFVGGFIKRSRSSDLLGERKSSNNFSQSRIVEGGPETRSPTQTIPPKLPTVEPAPQLQTFGGENYTPVMEKQQKPAATSSAQVVHNRAESMTHRGRESYAVSTISSINSPRRMRRRKDPTSYNILIVGARNSGKTEFLNFLKSSIAPLPEQQNARNPELDLPPPSTKTNSGSFIQHYLEIEEENERVGISIWDSQGFEKNIIDFQLREMSNFVESKFEDTFIEEMKVVRSPGYRDTHIHCVFILFDPAQLEMNIRASKNRPHESYGSLRKESHIIGALDEDFELQILKTLQGKTTVIPVISKADTVTAGRMKYLKDMVGESFLRAGLDPLEALHFEGTDDEDNIIDEADEEDEESITKESTEPLATQNELTSPDDVEPASASSEATESTTPAPRPQSEIKRALSQKRSSSKMSVSSFMFDNGYMPMSILSPDEHSLNGPRGTIGRQFMWGFADPYNPSHCDFVKLRETCFTEWRPDFKEASREVFYERWRTGRLNNPQPMNGVKKATASNAAPPMTARKPSGGIPIELSNKGRKYT